MNALVLLALIASALLGVLRGIDLIFGTDPVTQLCVVGSVWWRYAALGAVVALSVIAGRTARPEPAALRARQRLASVLALCGAVFVLLAAVSRLYWRMTAAGGAVRSVLDILCGLWLLSAARAWNHKGAWQEPFGGITLGAAGSFIFYWRVLSRFMENSSSWQRPAETAAVWQYMAALLFMAALARCVCLPGEENAPALCASGLAAFGLCFCWQVPQLLFDIAQSTPLTDLSQMSDYFGAAALSFIGALGGVCAAASARRAGAQHAAVG